MIERAIKSRKEELAFMKSQLVEDTKALKRAIQEEIIRKQEEIPALQKELMEAIPELKADYGLRIKIRQEEIANLEKRLAAIPDKSEIRRRIRLVKDEIKKLR